MEFTNRRTPNPPHCTKTVHHRLVTNYGTFYDKNTFIMHILIHISRWSNEDIIHDRSLMSTSLALIPLPRPTPYPHPQELALTKKAMLWGGTGWVWSRYKHNVKKIKQEPDSVPPSMLFFLSRSSGDNKNCPASASPVDVNLLHTSVPP